MGHFTELVAEDGHRFSAWRANPPGVPIGRLVVIQEIFGVNSHIRAVCDRLAAEGFRAVAPALFDRQVRSFTSGYSPEEVNSARELMKSYDPQSGLLDVEAARTSLAGEGPVAVIGFCLGGSVAWKAAARGGFAGAVCYYGGQVLSSTDLAPACPVQMHFGREDKGIPVDQVEAFAKARPEIEVHLYNAGHGFNCDERASYDPAASALAMERSMAFLRQVFLGAG